MPNEEDMEESQSNHDQINNENKKASINLND
jgi:hypothetical protein